MDDAPVTIIVKAPNQQFEDQTIKCEISWTIKRLKNYLSEVYPNKPKSEEQKLIYSGQLLNDTTVLKDILRHFEGQDTHTVHLVFTPKNNASGDSARKSAPRANATGNQSDGSSATGTSETDGLRQRFSASNNISNPNIVGSGQPLANMTYEMQQHMMLAQQYAMQHTMQQIYLQYLQQYMNSLAPNQNTTGSQPATGSTTTSDPVPYMQPLFPHLNNQPQPLFQSPLFQHPLNQMPPQPPPAQQQPPNVDQPPAAHHLNPAAAGADPPADAPAAAGAAVQRYPNVVQDEVENHDWLDMFYASSRLLVLVTLVYFYSSPLRCLIVILFIILYYMYHVGYFRQLQNLAEANNNNPAIAAGRAAANGNPNEAADAGERPDAVADDAAAQPAGIDEANAGQPPPSTTEVEPANHRTPVIALIRTVILSFFASLIPDTPAL